MLYTRSKINDRYGIPIFIVKNRLWAEDEPDENGCIHDDYRINYLRQHIFEMEKAILSKVDLFGYTVWSALDIVSSGTGEMRKRYGFIYVNKDDQWNGTMKQFRKNRFTGIKSNRIKWGRFNRYIDPLWQGRGGSVLHPFQPCLFKWSA